MSPGSVALCLLLMQTGVYGFNIELDREFAINFIGQIISDLIRSEAANQKHEDITQRAILNITLQACRAVALADGKDFSFPSEPFTVESVAAACRKSKSSKRFRQTIKFIQQMNRLVDARHASDPEYHFDNEKFAEGRRTITRGLEIIKASNKEMNFEAARERLGEITHPLQDFYTHSNWVELGNTLPNTNLIRSGTSIGNTAASSRATCRNCDGDDCTNNILEDIKREKIL
uniref:VWA7 N-terminal domain-containing protein n=1 Tax=Sparus aurata TaxID=8175 RepID=A0A671TZZ7_SPAAU